MTRTKDNRSHPFRTLAIGAFATLWVITFAKAEIGEQEKQQMVQMATDAAYLTVYNSRCHDISERWRKRALIMSEIVGETKVIAVMWKMNQAISDGKGDKDRYLAAFCSMIKKEIPDIDTVLP